MSPRAQPLKHRLRALDDCVRKGLFPLDVCRRVATSKADLEDVAGVVHVQRVHAALHVRHLPLHHYMSARAIDKHFFIGSVASEAEFIRPAFEWGDCDVRRLAKQATFDGLFHH
jgi:hypothetical protein